jgi:hypothetical protein
MLLLAFVVGLPRATDTLLTALHADDESPGLADLLTHLPRRADDTEEWERLNDFRESRSFERWFDLTAGSLQEWADRVTQYSFVPPTARAAQTPPEPAEPEPPTRPPSRRRGRGRGRS